ncbi:MAG TPA: PLDc N-terminal domain-containing protein, partial [Gammaproteobacteria bacterium]
MPDSLLAGLIVLVFHVIVAPVAVGHALLYKRDYRSALGWIGISILFPVAGPLLYFFFGVNRLRQRARELHGERENAWSF